MVVSLFIEFVLYFNFQWCKKTLRKKKNVISFLFREICVTVTCIAWFNHTKTLGNRRKNWIDFFKRWNYNNDLSAQVVVCLKPTFRIQAQLSTYVVQVFLVMWYVYHRIKWSEKLKQMKSTIWCFCHFIFLLKGDLCQPIVLVIGIEKYS